MAASTQISQMSLGLSRQNPLFCDKPQCLSLKRTSSNSSSLSSTRSGGFVASARAIDSAKDSSSNLVPKLRLSRKLLEELQQTWQWEFLASMETRLSSVGEDEFGFMLVDILKENNVESKGMRFDPGARTALAFVTLRKDGEREFMFYRNPSADMLLKPEELDADVIKQASIFHYGSISLIAEPCLSAHLAAMKIARESGALLSYDPNLRLPLWKSADAARSGIKSIWNEADIIKISEEEITFLTDGGDPYSDEAAQSLMHPNLKLLLVTEGQSGCRYYTKDFFGRVDGVKVETVDTTGAGDAFVAGILTQLVKNPSLFNDESKLREALLFANACGAIATTERGAIPALPSKAAVLQLLDKADSAVKV